MLIPFRLKSASDRAQWLHAAKFLMRRTPIRAVTVQRVQPLRQRESVYSQQHDVLRRSTEHQKIHDPCVGTTTPYYFSLPILFRSALYIHATHWAAVIRYPTIAASVQNVFTECASEA